MSTHNSPGISLPQVDRRTFLKSAGVAGVALAGSPLNFAIAKDAVATPKTPESIVKLLFESFTPGQKEAVCFDWDHTEPKRGLLRTAVSNNWNITSKIINSDFYTNDQRQMVKDIFEGIISEEWHDRYYKQLKDDAGGFGNDQSLAIFGTPGGDKFEFVMTGRHMTLRCDGNTADHVCFGGPLFYGHAGESFYEDADHPGNVFWEQAVSANQVYAMLDGKQRKVAEVGRTPREGDAAFEGKNGNIQGLPISEMSADQKEQMQKTLKKLTEMYRKSDQDEFTKCLDAQGGLDACSLAFYTDEDLGDDKVWDNWRLEGPSFVWHFRGAPHVHVWVNVADSPDVQWNVPRRG